MATQMSPSYEQYRALLEHEPLPAAFVNMDAFDENVRRIRALTANSGKTIRVASKSLRCPALLKHIFDTGGPAFRGVMCFTATEAEFLHSLGHDDLLVAYPGARADDSETMARLNAAGAKAYIIADCEAHLDILAAAGRAAGTDTAAVLEVDMSYRPAGNALHVGVRRSPLRSVSRVLELFAHAEKTKGVRIAGIMGYEAQIAGLPDDNPFSRAMNPARSLIKKLSRPYVAEKRQKLSAALAKRGVSLELFNGGGTGSLSSTSSESAVTEVTAGSGFFCPHLFSYYRGLDLVPAAFFALQASRFPAPGMATCNGGGYVASGEAGADRLPVPFLPRGCKLLPLEGAGEVQTPVALPAGVSLKPGDPVIFRHAKAGELSERFNEYLLFRNLAKEGAAPTYRGLGKAFL